MSGPRDQPPSNLSHLERLRTTWAKDAGVTAGRLRRSVAVLVVAGMLDEVRDDHGRHRFVVKGGARVAVPAAGPDVKGPRRHLSGRGHGSRRCDPHRRGRRLARLRRAGRRCGRDQRAWPPTPAVALPGQAQLPQQAVLNASGRDRGTGGGRARPGRCRHRHPLDALGVPVPDAIPCLSVRYQIAQKLHACTDELTDGRPNGRVHDLADLLLLDELLTGDELGEIRRACEDIFAGRRRHSWPPRLVVHEHRPRLWTAIQEEDGFEASLDEAVTHVRQLIDRIDAAR